MIIADTIRGIYEYGVSIGVVNGCGQKGEVSFSELFRSLSRVEHFIPEKGKECFNEVELGCGVHDILCEFGGSRTMKFFSDLWFSAHVFDRLSWWQWYYRIPFVFGLFIGLHYKGANAGNFEK